MRAPVDELDLVRRFYGEAREADAAAQRRARRALRGRYEVRPRRLHRLVAVAAALVMTVVGGIVLMPGGTTAQAARALQRFAVIATDLDLAAGGDPVVYERWELARTDGRTVVDSGDIYRFTVHSLREVWRTPGGAFEARERIVGVDFVSSEDRDLWVAHGRVALPRAGDETAVSADDLPLADLGGLPSEQVALLEAIRQRWRPDELNTDEHLLRAIGELLARGDAAPALRADLFRAAAQIPGIELLGTIRDPLDREGMGIALGPPERRVTLIVDPNTSVLLSVEERFPLMGEVVSEWIAYSEWATVPEIGDRPDGSDVV